MLTDIHLNNIIAITFISQWMKESIYQAKDVIVLSCNASRENVSNNMLLAPASLW